MPDFADSKKVFCDQMIDIERRALKLLDDMDNLNSSFSVHGFESGGKEQFVDDDFRTFNKQLTAAIVFDVMFAIGTIAGEVNEGQRNALREGIPGGLP